MQKSNAVDLKMRRILDLSRDLAEVMPLEQLLHKIVDAAATLTETEAAGVLLLNEHTGNLHFMVVNQAADQLLNIPVPLEQSVAGAAFVSREPVLVPNVTTDSRYYKAVEEQVGLVARSLLAVPLLFKEQCIGVLEVENKCGDSPFSQNDVELLTSLASQAAVAIENARLMRSLRQSRDALKQQTEKQARLLKDESKQRQLGDALRRAGMALSSTLNYDEVLDRILEQIAYVIPHDAANVMLIDGEFAHILRGRGYDRFGTAETLQATKFKFTEVPGLLRMWETQQPMAIPDVTEDKDWVYSRPEHHWIKSYAGVPMVTRTRVIGFLNVVSATPNFFSQDDAERLQTFAYHAATAIDNARLYRQAQKEIDERLWAERELQKHRDHLEELVAVRTEDLSTAVAQARLLNAQLQEEIVERERLIDDLRAFSHTVAHDLKSPLALITGYGRLLLNMFSDTGNRDIDEGSRKAIETIVRTAYRMGSIIAELLTLASVREQKIESLPLDMEAIIRDVEERLAHDIAATCATIIHPPTWPSALGYAPWIEEVWTNYLSNALKYGGGLEEDGAPDIELGWDIVDGVGGENREQRKEKGEKREGGVRFWVRDKGEGIPVDEQVRLFGKFTRLAGGRAKGHGLGLSIVKRIVEKLGGEVGVESQVGKGSTFFFTLPMAHPLDMAHDSERVYGEAEGIRDGAVKITSEQFLEPVLGDDSAINAASITVTQQLAGLPSKWISDLQRAALDADIMRLDVLIGEIKDRNSALGAVLETLAYEFDYGSILALVEKARVYKKEETE